MGGASRRAVVAWGWAGAYMCIILLFSSLQSPQLPLDDIPFRDKGVHFAEFSILGLLLAHAALRTWPGRTWPRTLVFSVWLAMGWAVFDEMYQAFVPGRQADTMDFLADVLGASTGATVRYLGAACARHLARRSARNA